MNSGEALAIVDRQDAAQALMPVLSVEQAVARYDAVVGFVKSLMHEGVDFGTIPGTDKPSLWKAGAEKLTTFFGLSKRFLLVEKIEDWSGADHGGEPFFYYSYRCALYKGDLLIAEADGSCNSFESKYRWRKAERVCPACGASAILKSKFEDGGWFCFKKKDGCGAKFDNGDPDIVSQQVGRIPNPDICDLVNTLQKMAQKRSFVGAALIGVNASEFFTQDLEDLVEETNGDARPASAAPAQKKASSQAPRPPAQASQANGKSAEEKALDDLLLAHCAKEKGKANGPAFFNAMYSKKSLEEKRQAVKTLGLAVVSPSAPSAPAPEPPPPAEDFVEGEFIESTPSPARLDIENLCDQLHVLGCSVDHINAKIAKITGGVYATDEINEADLPKVRMMLSRYVEMGKAAAAEIEKEFKK